MIAVIFEVQPRDQASYLRIAGEIKGELEQVEGFLSVERFQSLTNPDKLLSLSFFEDEAAVQKWRTLSVHREAQRAGRSGVFSDYRLRVAEVLRDYGMTDRAEVPADIAEQD